MSLTIALEGVTYWKKLATFLLNDAKGTMVPQIETTYHCNVEDCRDAMINHFLKSGDVTWSKVVESLKKAGYDNLAKKIEDEL